MNDLKYWPSNAGVAASSTLQTCQLEPQIHHCDIPTIPVKCRYFYHIPQRKDKSLQRFILPVLYYNDRLVNMSLTSKIL